MDHISKAPDLTGSGGRAWRCDIEASRRVTGAVFDISDSFLGSWLVEAPLAHPVWHSYFISTVHLRPIPGAPAAILHVTGASHEMLIHALHPSTDRSGVISDGVAPIFLIPMNFGCQFAGLTDDAALLEADRAASLIVSGALSPDTDFLSRWVREFNGSMLKGRPQ